MLTWKTVTMAQRRESKFFLSGRVSPSRSDPNLQPNRCIPRILTQKKTHRKKRNDCLNPSNPLNTVQIKGSLAA